MSKRFPLFMIVAAVLAPLWGSEAGATSGGAFKLQQLRLYQPEAVLSARTDVNSLARDAKQIQQVFESLAAKEWLPEVTAVLVAVAIRPGQRQRVWVEFIGKDAPGEAAKLEAKLAKSAAPEVKGLVAFELEFGREGQSQGQRPTIPEVPTAWREVAKKAGRTILIPDEAVDALWPQADHHGVARDGRTPTAPAAR